MTRMIINNNKLTARIVMKKKIRYGIVGVIILLLVGILAWKFWQKPEVEVPWGMTKAQIKEYERSLSGTLKIESTSSLLYQSRLFGRFPVAVEYEFTKGQLVRRKYMPLEKDLASDKSVRNVQTIRKRLQSRYGDPKTTQTQNVQNDTWTTPDKRISLRFWNTKAWTLEYQQNR